MESIEVEISTRAREREKGNEGNEGQRRALAEQHFFARAEQHFFARAERDFFARAEMDFSARAEHDFVQICQRIVGGFVYKCLLLSLILSYIFLYQPYPSLLPSP